MHFLLTDPPDGAVADGDLDRLFLDLVLPGLGCSEGQVEGPRWIFVCGQQGSGKTTCLRRIEAELGPGRTQRVCGDEILALLPPEAFAARDRIVLRLIDRLVDHAVTLRAHVLWERPTPGTIEGLAQIARSLGYRVEAVFLTVPALDSLLAAARRGLDGLASGQERTLCVPLVHVQDSARRWPALVARAEDAVLFDRIEVIDRHGQVCFQNDRLPSGQWAAQPFAFESLVIERARPRPPEEIAALLAGWQQLRAEITAANQTAWPPETLTEVDALLSTLAADPGTGFDLNQPSDPAAAQAWITRLRADLDEILSGPEAERSRPSLSARCDRLIALVRQVAGLPAA